MHKLSTIVVLASSLALSGCQTTVNGMDVRERSSSCVGFLVASGDGDSSDSSDSSGSSVSNNAISSAAISGGSVSALGNARTARPVRTPRAPRPRPGDACNGCWDY